MKRRLFGGEEPGAKKPKSEAEASDTSVSIVHNHIYFYGEVSPQSILDLRTKLFEASIFLTKVKAEQEILNPRSDYDPYIYLHINSPGGCLVSGLSGLDAIQSNKIPVITIVEGEAASAATLLAMAGIERLITEHSCMRIHQLRSGMWGKYDDLQDEAKNLDMFDAILKDFYKEKTKLTDKEVESLLRREFDFSAKVCLKKGFVDEII